MVQKVINSEPGRGWLHANLTAEFTVLKKGQRLFKRPRIWLLTGIYVAENPHCKIVRNHGWNAQAKVGVPVEPSGATSVQAGSGGERGENVEKDWTMPGKRVWACKWLLLNFDFDPIKMTEAVAKVTPFHVEITNRYARGNVRSGDDLLFARLEIASSDTVDKVDDENSEGEELSEEDWIAFDKCKEEADIEYEE